MGIEIKTGNLWVQREKKDEDPLEFLRENYDPDITRGQLSKIDGALYKVFWRRRLLDAAIPKRGTKFGDDVFGYYTEHYPGKTRGEIRELDKYLYEKLARGGLLERVPKDEK